MPCCFHSLIIDDDGDSFEDGSILTIDTEKEDAIFTPLVPNAEKNGFCVVKSSVPISKTNPTRWWRCQTKKAVSGLLLDVHLFIPYSARVCIFPRFSARRDRFVGRFTACCRLEYRSVCLRFLPRVFV